MFEKPKQIESPLSDLIYHLLKDLYVSLVSEPVQAGVEIDPLVHSN